MCYKYQKVRFLFLHPSDFPLVNFFDIPVLISIIQIKFQQRIKAETMERFLLEWAKIFHLLKVFLCLNYEGKNLQPHCPPVLPLCEYSLITVCTFCLTQRCSDIRNAVSEMHILISLSYNLRNKSQIPQVSWFKTIFRIGDSVPGLRHFLFMQLILAPQHEDQSLITVR